MCDVWLACGREMVMVMVMMMMMMMMPTHIDEMLFACWCRGSEGVVRGDHVTCRKRFGVLGSSYMRTRVM